MIDRIRETNRGQWIAGLVLAVLALAAVPAYTLTRDEGIRDFGMLSGDPEALNDGFNHLVVSYDEAAPALALEATEPEPETEAPVAMTAGRVEIPVPTENGQITPQALADLKGKGRLVSITRKDDQLVAIVEAAATPATASTTLPASRAVVATTDGPAALIAVPGTRKVEAVAPGVYAVTTSASPDVYQSVPGVTGVEQDTIATIFTNDPLWSYQWYLENKGQTVGGLAGTPGVDIGVEDAWEVGDGAGQVVAVIDTGMDIDHPDLAGSIWQNPGEICGNGADDDGNGKVDDCRGWDFVHNDARVQSSNSGEDDSHATHIAGTIAARTGNGVGVAGIAPGAKVMPLKVGDGGTFWMSTAAAALRYAVDEGATIVNCSFGGDGADPTFKSALDYAAAHGVLVVAAAGNSSRNIDTYPTYPASFTHDNLVTVAASTNQDTPAGFSNWGKTSVDLYAPGQAIAATVPQSKGSYGLMNGTSMAAPTVAAAAAVIRAAEPGLDPVAVKARILDASPAMSEAGRPTVSGRRLDLGAIVNPSGDGVTYTVAGLAGAKPDSAIDLSVQATVPESLVPDGERVRYQARLFAEQGGQAYGVIGHPVDTAAGLTATDDEAQVDLGEHDSGGPVALPLSFGLPAGRYALVTEAFAATSGTPVGKAAATYFIVSADNPAPPTTGPSGGTPTTQSGTPTTKSPSAPTTKPGTPTTGPGGGSTPTTKPGTSPTSAPSGGPTPTAPKPTTAPTTRAPGAPTTQRPGSSTTTPTGGPTTAPASGPTTTKAGSPTTKAPTAPTNPPATSPTTTVPGVPTTLPPAPPPVSANGITISSVTPRSGPTSGGTHIRISGGGFTGNLYVKVGGMPVTPAVLSVNALSVTTPAHTAGSVDIEVGRVGGGSVVYRDGFIYQTPNGGGGGGGTTTTTWAMPEPGPTPTTTPGGYGSERSPFTFGPEEEADNGLRLRLVTGGPTLAPPSTWGSRACTQATCTASPLRG